MEPGNPDPEYSYGFHFKKNWFAKLGTNSKYKLSEVPGMPLYGLEQVRLCSEDFNVVMLGKTYIPRPFPSDWCSFVTGKPSIVRKQFIQDFHSLIWVTYRSEFRPIESSGGTTYTSDIGWGCTIRVAQMLLLNALKTHLFPEEDRDIELLELIQENRVNAAYSIHEFCKQGSEFNKGAGDWYSPSNVSFLLSKLTEQFPCEDLRCTVFLDSIIFKDQLFSLAMDLPLSEITMKCLCARQDPGGRACDECSRPCSPLHWRKPVLVLTPLMLGVSRIQPEYYSFIQAVLRMKECVGIIGGKPKSALYFVGYQHHNFLILDPHLVRTACKSQSEVIKKSHKHHCKSAKLLPFAEAESSMSIGFYFRDVQEFFSFEEQLRTCSGSIKGLITISDRSSDISLEAGTSDEEFIVL